VRHRKTDYGTIILHWLLVAAFGVAFITGLRIATEAPGRSWINLFDAVLPRESVWVAHMQASVVLVAVSLAYTIYLVRSGLGRRIWLDKIRLRGLFGGRQARLGAFNVVLYWVFFVTMLALIASGGLLYFGLYAGHDVATLHWYGTWIILAFSGLHILAHYRIGGASQLLRIFRPTHLSAPPQQLDAIELLTLLAERSARPASQSEGARKMPSQAHVKPAQPPSDTARNRPAKRGPVAPAPPATAQQSRASKPRSPTLQSNPFVVAAAIAITGASVIVATDRLAVDSLQIHRIHSAEAPILDGDTSDRAWRNIRPFSLMTSEGGNFDGKGETRIEIRAVHDGTWAYFLFTWEDPTRSLKHLPLVKEVDGWHLLHNGYETGDEHEYNEDKFSVLLTTSDAILAGDRTFHASPHPIPGAPATMTGRGLHFTEGDTGYVDVWQWKATSGGPTGWMDDAHFGPPLDATPAQVRNIIPYRGGFAPDPGIANYTDNFVVNADATGDDKRTIAPRRLPKDLAATVAAMGEIDLDPNRGESDGARWFMTEAESIPYGSELDAGVPVGTVIPGVIVAGEFSGDRADVRCAARWASGHWALEVARRIDTHSQYDVPLKTGIFMRVAAFDHSQIRHTRHVRPILLEVE
jgi:Ethylbenzene dehydrogenase/Prokaryotic cytochrome b561